jgi:diguanylate cyclase
MGPKPLSTPQFRPGRLHSKAPPGPPTQAGLAPVHDSGIDPHATCVHSPSADEGLDDWHDLLNAVVARLRQTVGDRAAALWQGQDAFLQIRTGVLDCATALDQLHATLAHELGRRRRLDPDMGTTRAALAQTRAELAGTQAEAMRLRHMALHDSLTGLPNRRSFCERLQRALAQAGPHMPLAVLYLDLDGFKSINDTHGHPTGDMLLQIVAARLARAVRAEDMMSRLGDDEFGCLLTGWLERDQLVQLAGKLFNAVSAPLKCGLLRLCVQPSIGIALYPVDGESADELLAHADAAMHGAKRQRSGHAFFAAHVPA